jgi:hypothetical protein
VTAPLSIPRQARYFFACAEPKAVDCCVFSSCIGLLKNMLDSHSLQHGIGETRAFALVRQISLQIPQ